MIYQQQIFFGKREMTQYKWTCCNPRCPIRQCHSRRVFWLIER